MRILLVENDKQTTAYMRTNLKQAGFVVDHASDGQQGYHLLSTESYVAAIVDTILPKLDGLMLIARIRQKGQTVPVIFISSQGDVADCVKGLQSGGDDFLVKPFAFSELLARLQALIRRGREKMDSARLVIGDLELDLVRHRVVRAGRTIDLQPREFSLLEYLMRNAGYVASKTMIMEHVWNYNFDPATSVVDTCVCRLRTKVNKGFPVKLIRTLRGAGYVLDEPS